MMPHAFRALMHGGAQALYGAREVGARTLRTAQKELNESAGLPRTDAGKFLKYRAQLFNGVHCLKGRFIFATHLCLGREVSEVAFINREECRLCIVKTKVNFSDGAVAVFLYHNFSNARPV